MQGSTIFGPTKGATFKKPRKLVRSVTQPLIQHPATRFRVRKWGYCCHGCRAKLSAHIFVKIRPKCHVFQLVGPVSPVKRAVTQASHEP